MNKIIVTHGGQKQIVSPAGRILAIEAERGDWRSPMDDDLPIEQVLDLLTPVRRTLVVTYDVSDLNENEIGHLYAAACAQGEEAVDLYPDVEVGPKIVLEVDSVVVPGALQVGLGL